MARLTDLVLEAQEVRYGKTSYIGIKSFTARLKHKIKNHHGNIRGVDTFQGVACHNQHGRILAGDRADMGDARALNPFSEDLDTEGRYVLRAQSYRMASGHRIGPMLPVHEDELAEEIRSNRTEGEGAQVHDRSRPIHRPDNLLVSYIWTNQPYDITIHWLVAWEQLTGPRGMLDMMKTCGWVLPLDRKLLSARAGEKVPNSFTDRCLRVCGSFLQPRAEKPLKVDGAINRRKAAENREVFLAR